MGGFYQLPTLDVGDVVTLLGSDGDAMIRPQDWAELSESWREDLDDRILHLQRLRDNLAGCIGCGCLSLKTCSLANPGDVLAGSGPGPVRL